MQLGIVGLPNVGKSTLFNTLTKMGIPAENFPFCTIDPNNVSLTSIPFHLNAQTGTHTQKHLTVCHPSVKCRPA